LDISELVSLLVGLVAGVGLARYAEARQDVINRYEDLCKAVLDASNLATDYWLTDGKHISVPSMEARLIGFQHQVLLLVHMLEQEHWTLIPHCGAAMDEWLDALTGGEFQVAKRPTDVGRAQLVQSCAAVLVSEVRSLRRRQNRFWLL
jgi:hypothetical protein